MFSDPQITLGNYYVVVDSSDITPSNGFNDSFGLDDVWAEQTYASAGGLYLDSTGVETVSSGGALFGGYSGTRSDDASSLAGAEHVSQVTVSNATNGVADFGFSFNVVTNTLGGDSQDDDANSEGRTVQGSLRQFIQNANAIDNSDASDIDNALRFVARNAANSADATWWSVVVSEALPAILDSHTTIDGTVYAADGSGVLDVNDLRTDRSGTVTTVGANDSHTLNGFDQPEFEIVADQTLADGDRVLNGLVFAANENQTTLTDITVRNLSIHGFGSASAAGANISLAGGGIDGTSAYSISDVLIENTFVGIAPDGSHETILRSTGIAAVRAVDGVIQDSLIGFHGLSGIHFKSSNIDQDDSVATGWQILRNEISNNGAFTSRHDGIGLNNSSGTVVRHNLIADNAGFGIDSFFSVGEFVISENTITRNGLGGVETGGIRLFGDNSLVSQNRIVENSGTGISVIGTAQQGSNFSFAATGNELTQNQFGDNSGIDIDLVSSISNGQAFSDITVDGIPVAGLDTDGDGALSEDEIASTGLTLPTHDTNGSGEITRSEYNNAQSQQLDQGDGESASDDGTNPHAGNLGLDQPTLTDAVVFSDRVELEFDIPSGVDRVELYEVTVVGSEERVTFVTSVLVSNMTVDASTGRHRVAINPSQPVSGRLTAIAFDGSNTSEFGNRIELNHVPTAENNTVTTDEDVPLELTRDDFGFTDAEDGDDLSQGTIIITSVNEGTLTFRNGDALTSNFLSRSDLDNLIFTPTLNSNAQGSIEFIAVDSDGNTDETVYTLKVNITPVNDLPTAENNEVTATEDIPLALGQDDFGFMDVEDGDDVTQGRIDISSVSGGVLTLNGDDVLTLDPLSRSDLDNLIFTPTLNSTAQGAIEFTATESNGVTDGTIYTLSVNVTPVNDLPTAENNEVTATEDIPLELGQDDFGFMDVEDGDDVSQGRIDISSVSGGVLTLNGDDVLTLDPLSRSDLDNLIFTPTLNSTAQGAIEFTATESNGATDGTVYTLSVNVTPVNDAPVTVADNLIEIAEDTPLNLSDEFASLLSNDTDVDGDTLSVDLNSFSAPVNGTLSFNAAGDLIYTPDADSVRSETLTYNVTDGTTTTSSTLTINVTPVNDLATAVKTTSCTMI